MTTVFPQESANIEAFFHFLLHHEPADFVALRNKTFQQLLDRYFYDPRIKAILSLPVLGNGDLPPSCISAFTGAKIYSEFLLDGGYYPTGGMQMLSDMLAARFKELGGELLLASPATKIVMEDQRIMGVAFRDNKVSSSCVVANCDAKQIFTKLIQRKHLNEDFLNRLNSILPSQSMFVLYLGINEPFRSLPKPGTNVWFLPHYDIEKLYQNTKTAGIRRFAEYYGAGIA
jgi:phytoene dehydrogenase-like protein